MMWQANTLQVNIHSLYILKIYSTRLPIISLLQVSSVRGEYSVLWVEAVCDDEEVVNFNMLTKAINSSRGPKQVR